MKDVLMETVWKRRKQLLREHGGIDGVLQEVARIEAERLQAEKRRLAKVKKQKTPPQASLSASATARGRRTRTATQTSVTR